MRNECFLFVSSLASSTWPLQILISPACASPVFVMCANQRADNELVASCSHALFQLMRNFIASS